MDGWTEILFRQTKIVAVHITIVNLLNKLLHLWCVCSLLHTMDITSTHSMCMKQLQWSETSPANNNNNEWNVKSNCGCGIFFFVYAEFNVFRFIIILRMHANQTLWHCYWTFQTPTTPIRSEMVYTHSFHFFIAFSTTCCEKALYTDERSAIVCRKIHRKIITNGIEYSSDNRCTGRFQGGRLSRSSFSPLTPLQFKPSFAPIPIFYTFLLPQFTGCFAWIWIQSILTTINLSIKQTHQIEAFSERKVKKFIEMTIHFQLCENNGNKSKQATTLNKNWTKPTKCMKQITHQNETMLT